MGVTTRYFTGAGVDANTEKAMELWESAAQKGDTEAIYLLGLCYTGIGAGEGKNVQFMPDTLSPSDSPIASMTHLLVAVWPGLAFCATRTRVPVL